jgi:hypothetical protein
VKSGPEVKHALPQEPLLEFREKKISTLSAFTMARQKDKGFSIADAQQVLPLAKVALEAHALGDLKRREYGRA